MQKTFLPSVRNSQVNLPLLYLIIEFYDVLGNNIGQCYHMFRQHQNDGDTSLLTIKKSTPFTKNVPKKLPDSVC